MRLNDGIKHRVSSSAPRTEGTELPPFWRSVELVVHKGGTPFVGEILAVSAGHRGDGDTWPETAYGCLQRDQAPTYHIRRNQTRIRLYSCDLCN
jgi:hypothetical protein